MEGILRYSFIAKHPRHPLRWNQCRNPTTLLRRRHNFFVVLLRPTRRLRRRGEQPLPCRLRAVLHLGTKPIVRLLRRRFALGVDGCGNVRGRGPCRRLRMLYGGDGAVGNAEELVGNQVELFVYRTDDALDGFLNGADAGDGGGAHCENFDGKLIIHLKLILKTKTE